MRKNAFSIFSVKTLLVRAAILSLPGCSDKAAINTNKKAVSFLSDFSVGDSLLNAHVNNNGLEDGGVRYERSVRSFLENADSTR